MRVAITMSAKSKSGREMIDLDSRTLRGYECHWCGQRLDRMSDDPGNCAQIGDRTTCWWAEYFHGRQPA